MLRLPLRLLPASRVHIPIIAATLLFSLNSAHADWWERWIFAGDVDLDARYAHARDEEGAAEASDTLVAGVALSGFAGKGVIGYVAGLDAHFGGGLDGGFAYEFDLHPVGLGLSFGHVLRLGVTVGLGVHGLTGRIPFAIQFPLQASLDVNLGRRVHLSAWVTSKWITFADGRQDGSASLPFGDELSSGVFLRLGKGGRQFQADWGNGYYLGVTYDERMGTSSLGGMIGYSIDTTFGG